MKKIPDDIYKKIIKISDDVKKDLRRKGIVIPVKNTDGTVSVGYYTIKKLDDGTYIIESRSGDPVVDNINLPQTAAVIANNLALGKFKDTALIDLDRKYGFAVFDEQLYTKAVAKSNKKSLEYFDLVLTKCLIARAKKEKYKTTIVKSFEKLIKLV